MEVQHAKQMEEGAAYWGSYESRSPSVWEPHGTLYRLQRSSIEPLGFLRVWKTHGLTTRPPTHTPYLLVLTCCLHSFLYRVGI